jgi:hypothetical protein
VQLSDSTSTTSSILAATPTAVKSAYDLANAAVAKSIVDAKGDLIAATAADTVARLPIGTNAQVLTADSAEATGMKWATPATTSSGMTLITRQTFSGVAGVNFTNVFSSTYAAYVIFIEDMVATSGNDDALFQFLYSTSTVQTGYYGGNILNTYQSSAATAQGFNGTSGLVMSYTCACAFSINVSKAANASYYPLLSGVGVSEQDGSTVNFGGYSPTARNYTGFRLVSSSSNISGAAAIYGLAK